MNDKLSNPYSDIRVPKGVKSTRELHEELESVKQKIRNGTANDYCFTRLQDLERMLKQ